MVFCGLLLLANRPILFLKIWQAWYMPLTSNMLILAGTCDFVCFSLVSPVSLASLVSLVSSVSPVSQVSPVSTVSPVSPVPSSFYTKESGYDHFLQWLLSLHNFSSDCWGRCQKTRRFPFLLPSLPPQIQPIPVISYLARLVIPADSHPFGRRDRSRSVIACQIMRQDYCLRIRS